MRWQAKPKNLSKRWKIKLTQVKKRQSKRLLKNLKRYLKIPMRLKKRSKRLPKNWQTRATKWQSKCTNKTKGAKQPLHLRKKMTTSSTLKSSKFFFPVRPEPVEGRFLRHPVLDTGSTHHFINFPLSSPHLYLHF